MEGGGPEGVSRREPRTTRAVKEATPTKSGPQRVPDARSARPPCLGGGCRSLTAKAAQTYNGGNSDSSPAFRNGMETSTVQRRFSALSQFDLGESVHLEASQEAGCGVLSRRVTV